MREKYRIIKYGQRIIYPVLSILIPCILGIIGMVYKDVSFAIWIQNLSIIFLAAFVCMFFSKYNLKFNYKMIVFVSVFSLGLTFLGPSMEGVHRWIKLSFITLNISAIVMPISIAALNRLIEEKQFAVSVTGIIVIAFLLYLQPDASQLLAFALPISVSLLKSSVSPMIKGSFSAILFFLTLESWIRLDNLQPVNYTEGVLTMLYERSVILYIIGIAALFWIPVYFLIFCKKKNRNICIGITMYYWLMILSTFIGNFPVPFMGYGISPILGFYIFLLWFIHESKVPFQSI